MGAVDFTYSKVAVDNSIRELVTSMNAEIEKEVGRPVNCADIVLAMQRKVKQKEKELFVKIRTSVDFVHAKIVVGHPAVFVDYAEGGFNELDPLTPF